jgi:dTDP-4-amino-4,6-dideoxygalactose transaminase
MSPPESAPAMQVPLLDLKPQYQPLAARIQAAIERVCATQHFILGPAVRELEASVAGYCQCRHGIGVSSGTDALLLALMALGIGAGDAVVTSPFTFFATAGTIARTGARPLFCDIDPVTFNLSPTAVSQLLEGQCERRAGDLIHRESGARVRAIMPVHLYGQVADMERLMETAGRYGLRVIEDAAQAIGAADAQQRRAGSFGDVGCLSFFPTKNLGAFGDAGMCVTNDAALAERMEVLRVHGGKPRYYHALIGGNFRIDELQAAVLNVKLPHLDEWTAARQRNAAFYDAAFARARLGSAVRPPRVRAVCGTSSISTWCGCATVMRCVSTSAAPASAPRSTTRCRCICSNASPISGTAAASSRSRSRPRRRRSPCRSIRS